MKLNISSWPIGPPGSSEPAQSEMLMLPSVPVARKNGYLESFNGKLRDELLNMEIFDTLLQVQVLTQQWRKHYNTVRPHSALNSFDHRPRRQSSHGLQARLRLSFRPWLQRP